MKYLGIDYGSKRIGISISNDEGTLAFPKEVVQNTKKVFEDILKIVESEAVEKIIVGKSVDSFGVTNTIQNAIDEFVKKLSSFVGDREIMYQNEWGSSVAASAHLYGKDNIAHARWTGTSNAQKRAHNDAHAATIILQRYLDRKRT